MRHKVIIILKAAISIFFIGLLIWLMRKNIYEILYNLKTAKLWLFSMAFILYFLVTVILSCRLKRVLEVQDARLSLREVTSLSLIGYFFSNFMPTSVGGDIVKAYYTSKSTDKRLESFTSIFIDRLIGLFSFIVIATVSLVFLGKSIENKSVISAISIMLFLSIIFSIFILNEKIANGVRSILVMFNFSGLGDKVRKLYDAIHSYKAYKKVLFQTFSMSLIAQIIMIFTIYLLAKSLSVHLPFGILLLVMPIITAVSMFPISLNGLGIREGAYVYFLGGIIGRDKAFAVSILYLGLFLMLSVIGGVMHLMRRHKYVR